MDWKAIEANETELQASIAEAHKEGSKEALSWAIAAESEEAGVYEEVARACAGSRQGIG